MADRRAAIETITTMLSNDFDNVVNKYRTVESLLIETDPIAGGADSFPFLNVNLGSSSLELDLSGQLVIGAEIPIIITAYDKVDEGQEDTLHIVMAQLIDDIVASLTNPTNTVLLCQNNMGITTLDIIPAEDEMHYDICVAVIRVNCVSNA